MWRAAENREAMLREAIAFTGDAELYGRAMLRVIREWPYSCEHNLTNLSQNRKAWIGHAACALERGFCEDVVREAWGHLTREQQDKANAKAQQAIEEWEKWQSDQLALTF